MNFNSLCQFRSRAQGFSTAFEVLDNEIAEELSALHEPSLLRCVNALKVIVDSNMNTPCSIICLHDLLRSAMKFIDTNVHEILALSIARFVTLLTDSLADERVNQFEVASKIALPLELVAFRHRVHHCDMPQCLETLDSFHDSVNFLMRQTVRPYLASYQSSPHDLHKLWVSLATLILGVPVFGHPGLFKLGLPLSVEKLDAQCHPDFQVFFAEKVSEFFHAFDSASKLFFFHTFDAKKFLNLPCLPILQHCHRSLTFRHTLCEDISSEVSIGSQGTPSLSMWGYGRVFDANKLSFI